MEADYERVVLVKPEVFMYKIPPRVSNRAYRAAEWNLESPDWNGRMRIISMGAKCVIKLEDKNTGELFAACPVDAYPSPAVESVSDSARYFVVRIKDESGRTAFIGIGFVDRADSFDFNVALQDHFKYLKKDEELAKAPTFENEKKLDLSFKDGQTIKINIGKKTETSMATSRPKPQSSGGPILLPPPPSSKSSSTGLASNKHHIQLGQPSHATTTNTTTTTSAASAFQSVNIPKPTAAASKQGDSLLLDFDSTPSAVNTFSNNSSNTNKPASNSAALLDLDFFQS